MLRILHFLSLAVITVWLVPREWPALKSRWLWPAIVCGQHSLETFCLGVFLSFAAHFVFTEVSNTIPVQIAISLLGIVIMVGAAALVSWYRRVERRGAGPRPPATGAGWTGAGRSMRTLGIVVLAGAIFIAPPCFRTAQADQTADHLAECHAAQAQIENDFPLPQVTKAIKKKQLDILVVGAGSSTLPGANGTNNAYPARLQAALTEKLPGVTVKVTTEVKSGRTALESLKPIATALKATKPALLIWQSGTVDAMQSGGTRHFQHRAR